MTPRSLRSLALFHARYAGLRAPARAAFSAIELATSPRARAALFQWRRASAIFMGGLAVIGTISRILVNCAVSARFLTWRHVRPAGELGDEGLEGLSNRAPRI